MNKEQEELDKIYLKIREIRKKQGIKPEGINLNINKIRINNTFINDYNKVKTILKHYRKTYLYSKFIELYENL